MSLLDDARELRDADLKTLTRSGSVVCAACFKSPHDRAGCPLLALPRIVAALEAAEHIYGPLPTVDTAICLPDTLRVVPREAYVALAHALHGETGAEW